MGLFLPALNAQKKNTKTNQARVCHSGPRSLYHFSDSFRRNFLGSVKPSQNIFMGISIKKIGSFVTILRAHSGHKNTLTWSNLGQGECCYYYKRCLPKIATKSGRVNDSVMMTGITYCLLKKGEKVDSLSRSTRWLFWDAIICFCLQRRSY